MGMKAGDRIRVTKKFHFDELGTVIRVDPDGFNPIRLDKATGEHDCDGLCEFGHGTYMHDYDVEILKEEKKMAFKIGDRVLVRSSLMKDVPATVIKVRGGSYGVEFDTVQEFGHDMGGECPSGRGWNVDESEIRLMEEKKMAKFAVGDKVMFRFMDDMIQEYGTCDKESQVQGPDMRKIDIGIRRYFGGLTATINVIETVRGETHLSVTWKDGIYRSYTFCDWMFILVEKRKEDPKKKLTVAEIEKIIGYGVEIVKEGK